MLDKNASNFFEGPEKVHTIYILLDLIWQSDFTERTKRTIRGSEFFYSCGLCYRLALPEVMKLERVFEIRTAGRYYDCELNGETYQIFRGNEAPGTIPVTLKAALVRPNQKQPDMNYLYFPDLRLAQFGNRIPDLAAQIKVKIKLW